MKKDKFFSDYLDELINVLEQKKNSLAFDQSIKMLLKIKKNKKKIMIFGNGGSASIASHFSSDLINISKIKCVNFNEANLITCFANDFGFENWIKRTVEHYYEKGDLLILISSSGESLNMIKAANFAVKNKLDLITLSGFSKNNSLKKKGKVNFWVNSKKYNIIENTHQIILLSLVDYFL